jgi:hypothetical protein
MMDIQKGDRVLVNLAPFIGWERRAKTAIPCRVLAVQGTRLQVTAEYPCRDVTLSIQVDSVEERLESEEQPCLAVTL